MGESGINSQSNEDRKGVISAKKGLGLRKSEPDSGGAGRRGAVAPVNQILLHTFSTSQFLSVFHMLSNLMLKTTL